MNSKKWLKSKRKGSSLALVACSIVILLVMGAGLLSLGLQGQFRAVRSSSDIAARVAADAGLTKALFEMNRRLEDGTSGNSNLPEAADAALLNCDATFDYAVTGDLAGGYTVSCTGRSGRAERSVSASLRLAGLWDNGILVKDTIKLYSGTLVDGYDSSDPSATDVPVQIATESSDADDISLQPGAAVDGEVLYGVDGHFPALDPPALPDMGTGIYTKSAPLTIGPENSGKYTSMDVLLGNEPGVLEIDGGEVVLHVTGDITLGNSCELIIKEGSSLVIYVEGDLVAGNESSVTNESKEPKNLRLYGIGEDQDIDLKAKNEWYGAVYAPDADVSIKAGADVYGSFISTNFENMNGNFVYYDAALRDVSTTDVGACFVVDRWEEE